MLQTVQFTAFIAPCSRYAADIFAFSCVRLRFANRTYGFHTNGLYPNRQAAVGCNKRSAVHHTHMLEIGAIHCVLYTLLMLHFSRWRTLPAASSQVTNVTVRQLHSRLHSTTPRFLFI